MRELISAVHPARVARIVLLLCLPALLFACISLASDPGQSLKKSPARFQAFVLLNDLHTELHDFELLLRRNRLLGILPVDQLWLQGSEWRSRQHPAYAIPPREKWPAMLITLQFVKRELIPLIGPVEVQSGFRTRSYNLAAGGASRSKHMEFSALDLRPQRQYPRELLHRRLKRLWQQRGKHWELGLGLYSGVRFHIDTGGYRSW